MYGYEERYFVKILLNNKILWFSIISLIFIAVFFVYFFQDKNQIKIDKFTLQNGLTVYLNEDHSKPEVFGLVVVNVGAKNDPVDATGMAHYLEHLLFKGTEELGTINWEKEKPHIEKIFTLYDKLGKAQDTKERISIQEEINEESLKANQYVIPNEFDNLVSSIGGTNVNASTDHDKTLYYNTFPPHQIERWLELYSHRFINPVFRGFQTELEAVYEEKNMYSDRFISAVREEFMKRFYQNHPYGKQTVIGTIEHLKNPSLTKMYKYFQRHYVANNMALVLVGDFESDKIKPMIKEKFGRLKKAPLSPKKNYQEKEFNGREFAELKLSPIELALLGFSTIPEGHADEVLLDVCNFILSNNEKSGLLDKLEMENKVLSADIGLALMNDMGASIITIIPKKSKQTLKEAEELVLQELEKLKTGNFPDWMLESAKNKLYVDYQLKMESNRIRAIMIADIFTQNRTLDNLTSYLEKLPKITKQDIVKIANKYYGKNYLAFHSKVGKRNIEKIQKPNYKPMVSNTKEKSKFAKFFETIPVQTYQPTFIDFQKDIQEEEIQKNVTLYHTHNPFNDVFSLTIKFGAGEDEITNLEYASEVMNYSGTKQYDINKLKSEFSKIGCSYSIGSNLSYLIIRMHGQDQKLKSALKLLNQLLQEPDLEKEQINILLENEYASRKIEKSEPSNVSSALWEYILYQENSKFLDRLSLKEIQNLKNSDLMDLFLKATQYETQIHYVGQLSFEEVSQTINNALKLAPSIKTKSPIVRKYKVYKEPTVYLVNKNNTAQSKIVFFQPGENFQTNTEAFIDGFNLYFGEDSSSLLFQEIREYRSLAYSVGGYYTIPLLENSPSYFSGYVGTQGDKTLESIEVYHNLLKDMPKKPERLKMIKDYLLQSSLSSRPEFRSLSMSILYWKLRGYKDDPLKTLLKQYKNLQFSEIMNFYQSYIQDKPIVIGIVGDKSRINTNELNHYGKVIELTEDKLFKD